uniref:Hypothetical chloroplast RF37 n=1 Tax=Dasya binghamiae TaxID=1896963 RepID=A0A1C8XRW8_9FLOR|nr:hypothetical chloroplast RF37 [Dasya binghamiae]AOH77232.1 hypothetical chloroplast RF37 [Dasya binghamiae]
MYTQLVLFYVYMFICLLFLVPLSYLISIELFYIFYSIILCYTNYEVNKLNQGKFLSFFNLYTKRKQWFLCISMLEFIYHQQFFIPVITCKYLAYCYKNLDYLKLAEYYYLQALSYAPSNIYILQNLVELYKKSNDDIKAEEINNRIVLLNLS